MYASIPDLLRLFVVPVLGWAAWRDVETRRVPNDFWYPIAVLGLLLLGWETWTALGEPRFGVFAVRVAISLFVVVPLVYAFWYVGGFGGADAKAFMAIALVYPTFPSFVVGGRVFPLVPTALGVFSLTVLTNTVLLGLAYPVVLAVRNLLAGDVAWAMFVGRRVEVSDLPAVHGSLLETAEGFTRDALDLDALRMYLRWRGLTLADLRANPGLRDPATLPDRPNDPTDGAVRADGGEQTDADGSTLGGGQTGPMGGRARIGDRAGAEPSRDTGADDPWGAAAFLDQIEGSAYGTTPQQLRDGLDLLVERDVVWVTPGVPFLVPTFVGLLVALVFGDLLFAAMTLLGVA